MHFIGTGRPPIRLAGGQISLAEMSVPGIIPGPDLLRSVTLRRQQLFERQQVGIGLRTFHYEAVIPGAVFVRSGIEPQRQRLLRGEAVCSHMQKDRISSYLKG